MTRLRRARRLFRLLLRVFLLLARLAKRRLLPQRQLFLERLNLQRPRLQLATARLVQSGCELRQLGVQKVVFPL